MQSSDSPSYRESDLKNESFLKLPPYARVARFFLVPDTKTGKSVPNEHNTYILNCHKISQISIKYSKWP
jgi:hypothetical protein